MSPVINFFGLPINSLPFKSKYSFRVLLSNTFSVPFCFSVRVLHSDKTTDFENSFTKIREEACTVIYKDWHVKLYHNANNNDDNDNNNNNNNNNDRLCGLVVRVSGYRSRGPGFDSWLYQIFWEVVGLERGPLSLVRITEELLE
jgi:hypothetical protein